MGVDSLAIVVLFALVWPSHQLLSMPDSCGVSLNPYTRVSCGSPGTTRESCLKQGCCYDDSAASSCSSSDGGSGRCFKPANCEDGDHAHREDIGWIGISREQCNCRGGCFDDSKQNLPTCYKPFPDPTCSLKKYEGTFIVLNNYKDIRDVSEEQCKTACSTSLDNKCKSAEYHRTLRKCWLSELTYEDGKEKKLLRENRGSVWVMYAVCPETVSTPAPTSSVPDQCTYKRYDNELIVAHNSNVKLFSTMTIEQCQTECNKVGKECLGYEYHKKLRRCFLSTVTYEEAKFRNIVRPNVDWITGSCPYEGPALTTAAPTPTTEPPIITNETIPECIGKAVDFMFVLDESSSIIPEDFVRIKEFAEGIVKKMPIAKNQTQVGIVTFSSSPTTRVYLRQGTSRARIQHQLKKIDQRGGNTYTHAALEMMIKNFGSAFGGREKAAKVAVIETDGASKNSSLTKQFAQKAHAAGIKVIAVGVGAYDPEEINAIASDPDSENVFKVDDFDKLISLVKSITLEACQDAPDSPDEPVTEAPVQETNLPAFCKDIPPANRTNNPPLYRIDPDGPNFGSGPFRVECDFTGNPPITIIHTEHEHSSCTENCNERSVGCNVQSIKYLGSIYQVGQAVRHADRCEQEVIYDCYNAALDYRKYDPLGPMTYWTNFRGQKMNYWPGGDPVTGGCACGKTGTCYNKNEKCNCDARDKVWRQDKGKITDQKALPIKEIAVGDVQDPNRKGCFTVGPLYCV